MDKGSDMAERSFSLKKMNKLRTQSQRLQNRMFMASQNRLQSQTFKKMVLGKSWSAGH